MKMKKIAINKIVIVFFILSSCSPFSKDIEKVLRLSGSNRSELERVLHHYKNHQEKYLAAEYLICNMPGKYSEDDKPTEIYIPLFEEWNRILKRGVILTDKQRILDSLVSSSGLASSKKKLYDINHITADYLINNIEMAFDAWLTQPWGKDISFDTFCEEILPHRLDVEPLEDWRGIVINQYRSLYEYMQQSDIDVVTASRMLLDSIGTDWELWDLWEHSSQLPMPSYSMTYNFKSGLCDDFVNLTTFAMRAFGMPVTRVFTPQWPDRRLGHSWNTITDKDKCLSFGLTENKPGDPFKPGRKIAKAYRKTFQKNTESLAFASSPDDIYPFFANLYIKDVSSEALIETVDVTLELEHAEKTDYVYLAVFNNRSWVPMQIASKTQPVVFSSMGRDIVYLPVYYQRNKITPCSSPFVLTKTGEVNILKANTENTQSLKLLRKHPILMNPLSRMRGGMFQASNYSDFSDAVTLYNVPDTVDLYFHDIVLDNSGYQYYRYYSSKGSCSIAELEFYTGENGDKRITGNMFGSAGSYSNDPNRTFDKVFDGDVLTFYDTDVDDTDVWVGMDFESRTKITKMRYLPRNDDNNIVVGQQYELFYWCDRKWISLGKQIPSEQVLYYQDAPTNALFLLRNHTKGKEERIFTYENGKQIFW